MNTVYQKYLTTFNIFLWSLPPVKLLKVKVTFSLASLALSFPPGAEDQIHCLCTC